MEHIVKNNEGTSLTFEAYCSHPELSNNTCPMGSGKCHACKYGKAELSLGQMLSLIRYAGWDKL